MIYEDMMIKIITLDVNQKQTHDWCYS